jgi:hypothetical protein
VTDSTGVRRRAAETIRSGSTSSIAAVGVHDLLSKSFQGQPMEGVPLVLVEVGEHLVRDLSDDPFAPPVCPGARGGQRHQLPPAVVSVTSPDDQPVGLEAVVGGWSSPPPCSSYRP